MSNEPNKTHTFTDALGRTWDLTLSVAMARRLKNRLDVDLLAVMESDVLLRLATDLELFVNALYVICQSQCEQLGLSDEDFGCGLGGDTLDDAAAAFNRALVDFFPQRRREVLEKLADTVDDFHARAAQMAMGKLTGTALEQRIAREFAEADRNLEELIRGGSRSGSSPAPSASIPGR